MIDTNVLLSIIFFPSVQMNELKTKLASIDIDHPDILTPAEFLSKMKLRFEKAKKYA
jgi:hypothetical protein